VTPERFPARRQRGSGREAEGSPGRRPGRLKDASTGGMDAARRNRCGRAVAATESAPTSERSDGGGAARARGRATEGQDRHREAARLAGTRAASITAKRTPERAGRAEGRSQTESGESGGKGGARPLAWRRTPERGRGLVPVASFGGRIACRVTRQRQEACSGRSIADSEGRDGRAVRHGRTGRPAPSESYATVANIPEACEAWMPHTPRERESVPRGDTCYPACIRPLISRITPSMMRPTGSLPAPM
jgi:hypothetical protein